MKKIFILLSINILLFAQGSYELKLFEQIIPAIFKQKQVKVYADEDVKELLKSSNKFQLVNSCSEANVIIIAYSLNNLHDNCVNRPIFATSYKTFKNNNNSFGAFYWRKGRPQIKFKSKTLDKYHLELPENLQKYAQ